MKGKPSPSKLALSKAKAKAVRPYGVGPTKLMAAAQAAGRLQSLRPGNQLPKPMKRRP